jgi:hypothetical protein
VRLTSLTDRSPPKRQGLLARLLSWLAGCSADPDASPVAVVGCIYLLLISLANIFEVVGRTLIMLLLLALLPVGRYLGSRWGYPRRWMFVVPAVLAAFESARSIGSVFRTHAVGSAIIACIALTFAVDFPDRMHGWSTARSVRWFCITAFLFVCFAHAALKPRADLAYPSVAAVEALSAGLNPYKVDLDWWGKLNTGDERFQGYKYSPLLPVFYIPTVKLFGMIGILFSNFIVLVLTALTVSALCWRILGGNGIWAAMLLLASPFVGWSVLVFQVNDLVAVFPICVAFLVWNTHPGLAGLLLGASASIKILPAPIAMALLLPRALPTARRFVGGIAVGLMPIIVFAALDPTAFFNNVILFEIVRPPSPSSWLLGMPSTVMWALRIGFVAAFLATVVAAEVHNWSIDRRIMAYVALTCLLLLASNTNYGWYWLWWIPPFISIFCAKWAVSSTTSERVGYGIGFPTDKLPPLHQPYRHPRITPRQCHP